MKADVKRAVIAGLVACLAAALAGCSGSKPPPEPLTDGEALDRLAALWDDDPTLVPTGVGGQKESAKAMCETITEVGGDKLRSASTVEALFDTVMGSGLDSDPLMSWVKGTMMLDTWIDWQCPQFSDDLAAGVKAWGDANK